MTQILIDPRSFGDEDYPLPFQNGNVPKLSLPSKRGAKITRSSKIAYYAINSNGVFAMRSWVRTFHGKIYLNCFKIAGVLECRIIEIVGKFGFMSLSPSNEVLRRMNFSVPLWNYLWCTSVIILGPVLFLNVISYRELKHT